jgi:hypothetical protein
MQPLTVRPYAPRGQEVEEIPVVDSRGAPIHEGDLVMIAVNSHHWLSKGEIVQVTGAGNGSVSPSLSILTMKNSQTGINSCDVVVHNDHETRKRFKRMWLQKRITDISQSISRLEGQRMLLQKEFDDVA